MPNLPRKAVLFLWLLTLPSPVFAQNGSFQGTAFNSTGRTVGGATITVCTATGTGVPCTPLATIFSDVSGTPMSNPFTADGNGNFLFFAAPNIYKYTITGPNITAAGQPFTASVAGTGGISAATNNSFTGNNTHSGTETFTGVIDLTGAGAASVQTALNNLAAGKTYALPCGTYTGPTTFPSNVSLVSLGGPIPNQIASLWGVNPGGSFLSAACTVFTYTANLTISQVQNLKLSGITLEFTNNNAGVILTSDSFFTWDDVIINRCGSTTQQCLLLNTTGTGAGQNTENNVFRRLIINAAPTGVSGPGIQLNGSIANSTFVTLNRFYDLNIGGKLSVAWDCATNCDTNFVYGLVVNSSVAAAIGLQFNNATPGSDQDANSNIIIGYSCAAGCASPFMRFGQSSGNYIVAQGNGVAPTIVGGNPDFYVLWTGATTNSPRIFTNGIGFQSDFWTYKNTDFSSALGVQSTTALSTRSANFVLRDNQATPQNITLRKEGANLVILDTANNSMAVPTGADTLVARATTDTLTKKTLACTGLAGEGPCIAYSTASASTNAAIALTTMATAGVAGNTYRLAFYYTQTALGVACTGNTVVGLNVAFTDTNDAASSSFTIASPSMVGNGTLGKFANQAPHSYTLRAKASTVVQYSTTYSIGAGCTTGPSYTIYPVLEQLQ